MTATSAIDYNTDNIIQKSLREKLPKDTTLIIVAHRLQTIMDADKIVSSTSALFRVNHTKQMVLDAGRIVSKSMPG